MNQIYILSIFLFCCNTNSENTRKTEQAVADTAKPKMACIDTSSIKTQSGFYLVLSGPTQSNGIQLSNKNEYYILDSFPVITMFYVDTSYKEYNRIENNFSLEFKFKGAGVQEWARFTRDNINKKVALVICDKLVSVATIFNPIPNGLTTLVGEYSESEIDNLNQLIDYEKRKAIQEYIRNRR